MSNLRLNSMKRKNNSSENNGKFDYNQEKLQKQLGILNLALIALFAAMYSIILNINFVWAQRITVLDKINNTNYSDVLPDLSDTPKKTNTLFLFAICIYTAILWQAYIESANDNSENRDEKLISDNYNKVIAILLFLLGTTINLQVLNT